MKTVGRMIHHLRFAINVRKFWGLFVMEFRGVGLSIQALHPPTATGDLPQKDTSRRTTRAVAPARFRT